MKTLNNTGIYAIKKCTLTSSEVVSTYEGDYKQAKQQAIDLENQYYISILGVDFRNETKRGEVKYFAIRIG